MYIINLKLIFLLLPLILFANDNLDSMYNASIKHTQKIKKIEHIKRKSQLEGQIKGLNKDIEIANENAININFQKKIEQASENKQSEQTYKPYKSGYTTKDAFGLYQNSRDCFTVKDAFGLYKNSCD